MSALKKLIKNNMLLVIIVIALLYFGPAIYLPAQVKERAIVTALGVDVQDNQYLISALVVVPTAEKTDSINGVELVSANGLTLADAVDRMSLDLGKAVGLAHCDAILLSDEALSRDLHSTLDYLNRSGELTKNAMLFNTDGPALDVLKSAISSKSVPALKLSTMVEYNKEHNISNEASLDGFYTNYFTPSSISLLPVLSTKDGGDSGGGQGQSDSKGGSKTIACSGDMCVLSKGIKVATLTDNNITCYNALRANVERGNIKMYGVDTPDGLSDMMLTIRKKNIKCKAAFIDNVPTVTYKGTLTLKLVELNTNSSSIDSLNEVQLKLTDQVKEQIKDKIVECYYDTLSLSVDNNIDIFEYDNLFSTYEHDKWLQYKQNSTPSAFLPGIKVNFDININEKY